MTQLADYKSKGEHFDAKMVMFALALPTQNLSYFLFSPFYFLHCLKMVNVVIFKAEQRNTRRSVFRLIVKYPPCIKLFVDLNSI